MKKLFLIITVIMLMASIVWAGPKLSKIGNTGDALITTSSGHLTGLIVNTDGTNDVTITLYDNTSASGTKIISTIIIPTSATNRIFVIGFDDDDIQYHTGIYVDITCAGTVTYDVTFKID
jgi:hypothetical protein